MKTTVFFLFSFYLLISNICLADSPITSTQFSHAYRKEAIVVKAQKSDGKITNELMDYLIGKNPIDLKVAVINELGWEGENRVNANIFVGYIMKSKGYLTEDELQKKAKPEELLCIAYLKAMDNYFDVSKAIVYADLALSKNVKSYTFQMITALIKAQAEMDRDWCTVYTLTNNVRNDETLKIDMKADASKIIFQYMDIYREHCNSGKVD